MIKKSIRLSGHATSLALEEEFWDALLEIAIRDDMSLNDLVTYQDCHRKDVNLASHLRVFVLKYYQDRYNQNVLTQS